MIFYCLVFLYLFFIFVLFGDGTYSEILKMTEYWLYLLSYISSDVHFVSFERA